MPLRVLLADDSSRLRSLLRAALEREGFGVEEAADGASAIDRVVALRPDVALLAVAVLGEAGLDALYYLRRAAPATPLLLLAGPSNESEVLAAFRAGVRGFVVKADASREIARAVREVAAGKVFLSAAAARAVIDAYLEEPAIEH